MRRFNALFCMVGFVTMTLCLTLSVSAAEGPAAPVTQASQPDAAYGQAVNGLQLGLLVAKRQLAVGEQVQGSLVFKNATDKPMLILPILVPPDTVRMEITGPDGKRVPSRGPMGDWDVPDYDVAVKSLKAGATLDAPLPLFGYDLSQPGDYRLTAGSVWRNAQPPPGRKPAVRNRGPIWTGEIKSALVTISIGAGGDKPTATQPAGGLPAAEGKPDPLTP